jgi:hypothetical protein
MKLTIFILALPLIGIWLAIGTKWEFGAALGSALLLLWILSGVFCFGWSFYISRRYRLLGWLCVVIPIIQLIVLMWLFVPAFAHGQPQ